MSKTCFIKGKVTEYNGQGEYWVSIANEGEFLLDEDYLIAPSRETGIYPEEIKQTLGRLLDEVDEENIPEDIYEDIEDLYDRACDLINS